MVNPDQQWTDEQLVEEFLREKGENSVHTREAYNRDLNQFRAFLSLEYGEKSLADADGSQWMHMSFSSSSWQN